MPGGPHKGTASARRSHHPSNRPGFPTIEGSAAAIDFPSNLMIVVARDKGTWYRNESLASPSCASETRVPWHLVHTRKTIVRKFTSTDTGDRFAGFTVAVNETGAGRARDDRHVALGR